MKDIEIQKIRNASLGRWHDIKGRVAEMAQMPWRRPLSSEDFAGGMIMSADGKPVCDCNMLGGEIGRVPTREQMTLHCDFILSAAAEVWHVMEANGWLAHEWTKQEERIHELEEKLAAAK